LQDNLKVGFALPVWGEGKNRPTQEAKQFIEEVFNQGQISKPVPPAEAVTMMQEKLDPTTGEPMFNEDNYLDEEQVKSMFGTISRPRKRSHSGSKKPPRISKTKSVGIDFDDDDNGLEKQLFEESLTNVQAVDEMLAEDRDSEQIENDLATDKSESDECPITVDGEDLCAIAGRTDFGLNVGPILAKLTKKKKDAIWKKILPADGDAESQTMKRRTMKQMEKRIFNYVKENCYCVVSFARAK
jgi:hypothetical protein